MKRIINTIIALGAAVLALSACKEELPDPLSETVSTDKTELILADTGTPTGTIAVTATGDWIAVPSGEEWFSINTASGNGNGTITVTATENVDDTYHEIAGPRSGQITVIGDEGMQVVTVKQAGEPGLDASRHYSKVTKADEIEAGKAYLIVANTGSELQAAKAFVPDGKGENYYSYIYGDVVTEEEGVIVRPNAANGFTLVAKDGGYAIQMPTGRYLFQAAAYNNFYSTEDLAKADVWKVEIGADGAATITNQTVSGKYFQYSIGYSSYGAYGGAQDNAVLPVLYKDSAAPSDEVLVVESETIVPGNTTSVSIPVSSNKTWKVRNHDSWIKSFTASGSGNGTIEITFDENTSYDNTREATFLIIGETTNFEVTLVQDHLYNIIDATVAEFKAAAVGDQLYRLTGKIRSIANSKYGNVYIEDGTDYVYVYTLFENDEKVAQSFSKLGVKEGDIITIVGPRDEFPGAKVEDQKIQMKNAYCEKAVKAQDATVSQVLAAPVASTYLEGQYYRVTGVIKSVVSTAYGNLYLKEKDSDTYIYVYGLTKAPVAKNDKSFDSLGLAAGDEITIVGQRGEYPGAKTEDQKIQMANSFFVSKAE